MSIPNSCFFSSALLESDYSRIEILLGLKTRKRESELLESYHGEIEKPLSRVYALAFFIFLLLKRLCGF